MCEKELAEKSWCLPVMFTSDLCDFYERDIARQKEFDILQKLLDHDRAQGFKQSNKRIAKMNNANK